MSSKSEEERERLKQEYKDHYRKIKELKERSKRAEQKGKIAQAVNNMNPDNILESVDEFLGKVRDKVTHVEARLDVAMDSMDDDSGLENEIKNEEHEAELKKQKAKQTLQQVKAEMGMLYSEIEKTADEIKTEKTIGTKKDQAKSKESDTQSDNDIEKG
jgi:hypothetical protein